MDVKPESDTQLFPNPNREAPAVFYDGASKKYYLWTSGCMGWGATSMHLYSADSPLGAFNQSGDTGKLDQGLVVTSESARAHT